MKRFGILFALALFFLLPTSVAAADCQFVLGFKTIRDLIGHDIVGECGENERYNAIGDSVQQTTGGLLVWRKSDNWTAFTDGYRTWINGPDGLVQRHHNERFEWELDYAPGGLSIINCRTDRVATFTQLPARSSPRADSATRVTGPSLSELARAAGWYRDGVDYGMYGRRSAEGEVLRVLAKIDRNSPHLAEVMSGWDWLFDNDMSWHEQHVAEYMALLDERLPAFVPPMTALPWIRDGIDELEAEAVEVLYREALCYDLEFAIEQATAPWVLDGLSAAEQQVFLILRGTEQGSKHLIPVLAQTSWVQDGLTIAERDALWRLMDISSRGRQYYDAIVLDILNMPFLDGSIDALDVAALTGMGELHRNPDRSYLLQLLSHPTMHGGVSDSHRSLLTGLGFIVNLSPKISQPELLNAVLDSPQDFLEERVIWLPRAGAVTLAVIRSRPGTYDSMSILERSVRAHEDFMLEAYPNSFVVVSFVDEGPGAGFYYGAGRIALPFGTENNLASIGHEAAHVYWSGRTAWISESGAEVLRSVVEGVPLDIKNVELSLCQKAENLADIERIEYEQSADSGYVTGNCPYVMGLGL